MSYSLEFTINQLPPMNTADGMHWRKRHKIKKSWEVLVWQEILNRRPILPLAFARVSITRHSSVHPDFDNLVQGGKFLLDSLVQNGVIRDDKPGVIGHPEYNWVKAAPSKGKVVVHVHEVAESPSITTTSSLDETSGDTGAASG